MKSKLREFIVSAALLVGIVDQINGSKAIIEYEVRGNLKHSLVSLDQSACIPREGQKVYFFKDYKIVTCEPDKS